MLRRPYCAWRKDSSFCTNGVGASREHAKARHRKPIPQGVSTAAPIARVALVEIVVSLFACLACCAFSRAELPFAGGVDLP